MNETDRAFHLAQDRLKEHPSRWNHTVRVAEYATRLSEKYHVPKEKVLIAAYLHDSMKYLPFEEAKSLILKYYSKEFMNHWPAPTMHALAAAAYAIKEGFNDEDVINAILHHTTGRGNMSLLEKIIFVSDYCEESRNFDNLDISKTAFENLDRAVYEITKLTIEYVNNASLRMMPYTLEAYEFYHHLMNGGIE